MNSYIALRFRKLPIVTWFYHSSPVEIIEKSQVIAKTQHGTEVGTVLRCLPPERTVQMPEEPFVREILRMVTDNDRKILSEIELKEKDAFKKSKELIRQHNLEMKLLRAEYLFDSSRLILYYKAENKVDFRELLKSLASTFRTRIELRQIGVRDETKLLGGIGCCGKIVCCAQFLTKFHSVSTKMAKDQNLSMNPAKLSGICCRLLCCIAYEHAFYHEFQGKYPKLGAEILVGTERGRVMDLNYITQKAIINFGDRHKITVPLSKIFGRKCKETGRNLWWVQEPGEPEPDLSILLQPLSSANKATNNRDSKSTEDDSTDKLTLNNDLSGEENTEEISEELEDESISEEILENDENEGDNEILVVDENANKDSN